MTMDAEGAFFSYSFQLGLYFLKYANSAVFDCARSFEELKDIAEGRLVDVRRCFVGTVRTWRYTLRWRQWKRFGRISGKRQSIGAA
jgi:hypothetical protein